MNIIVTVEYKDLFEDEPGSFQELISGIDSHSVIKVVCIFNAQLYSNSYKDDKQLELLKIWLDSIPANISSKIIYKFRKLQYKSKTALFSTHHLLGFLNASLNEIKGNNTTKVDVDLSPKEMLKMFKAYLFFLSYRDSDIDISNIPAEHFWERTWPLMISQFHINSSSNHFTTMVKSICFFSYFKNTFPNNVNRFLKETGFDNGVSFAYENLTLIQKGTSSFTNKDLRKFSFESPLNMIPFYESISIDVETYHIQCFEKENLKGLKESPLYRFKNSNIFFVIDWNLFASKFYDGLIFDFYNRSGIKTTVKNDFASHYKPQVALMTEKFLFKNLINFIFASPSEVVKFDDKNDSSIFPDAYIRKGKRIFLIEIKDALFSAKALISRKYEDIENVLDQKYNTNKKGTGQIAKQIEFLGTKSFEDKTFDRLGLKRKNLIIYPIIIYTDPNFGLPGMESYLNEQLRKRIQSKNLNFNDRQIKRLSFINLDFFIKHLLNFKDKKHNLSALIDYYEKQVNRNTKNYTKYKTVENHFKSQKSFQEISSDILPYKNDKGNLYSKILFEELGLMDEFD